MPIDAVEQKRLKLAVFECLKPSLADQGFKLKAAQNTFRRQHDGVTDMFHLVFLDNKIDDRSGWRIQPTVAVRNERIEEIFHQTSGFEQKYQADTATVGNFVGDLVSGRNRDCEFLVTSADDIPQVSGLISTIFNDFALPYFKKFRSIDAIDEELNAAPLEENANRGIPYFRCTTGVIVAKLVGRADYDDLVQIYTKRMKISDKGFYLKRFQALVDSLAVMER